MKSGISAIVVLVSCSVFSGCAVGPTPGKAYGKTPPQIIIQKLEKQGNKFVGGYAWDHPEYFGPVPENKKAEGTRICKSIKASKAIGYHPNAKSANGKPIKGGGYYCLK